MEGVETTVNKEDKKVLLITDYHTNIKDSYSRQLCTLLITKKCAQLYDIISTRKHYVGPLQ